MSGKALKSSEPSLAELFASAVYNVTFEKIPPATVDHVKTILIDSLGCIFAAPEALEDEALALGGAEGHGGRGDARLIASGRDGMEPEIAALVNGAMLRSRDLMDVYAGVDVSHPSEVIPAALAAADTADASGRSFLEALTAGLCLHVTLAHEMPLHPFGFHHTGHASIVAPLVISRILGLDQQQAASALSLTAGNLLVPEGFSRGQVTNLKTYAYGLQAYNAFQAVRRSGAGLTGSNGFLDEMVAIWSKIGGKAFNRPALAQGLDLTLAGEIWLKRFPAQYAMQPLIAAALRSHGQGIADRISQIRVLASRRTVERCADPPKFKPANAESADHSLPFCICAALIDGAFGVETFEKRRWLDPDITGLMKKLKAEPISEDIGYAVGRQVLELTLTEGSVVSVEPEYPGGNSGWREIAVEKLTRHAPDHVAPAQLVQSVDALDGTSVRNLRINYRVGSR